MKTAIVLGGTVPHCELIRQLKERGFYTILIDYLPNPPARAVADEHMQISTMDQEKVLQIALSRGANLVISACVDQANITACYVMEKLGLYVPYSYDTAMVVTNKTTMKKGLIDRRILTSRYIRVENDGEALFKELTFPLIVKPADSNSANGVNIARTQLEVHPYLKKALEVSRNHQAIVEEYVNGTEISAYCYIQNNRAKLLMTAERISTFNEEAIKCYASIAPARISPAAEANAERIATEIAAAFHLNNIPLFFQGIVRDDEISVIEFAPRIGGGSCFKTIKENTGVDAISLSIDSWLNNSVSLDDWHYPREIYAVNTVYGNNGVFDHISGQEKLLKEGIVEAIYPIKTKGDQFDDSRASKSRACFTIVKAADMAGIMEKVRRLYETIDIVDPFGRSLLNRELNLYTQWGNR